MGFNGLLERLSDIPQATLFERCGFRIRQIAVSYSTNRDNPQRLDLDFLGYEAYPRPKKST
jgi:hypothetical protein